MAVVITLTPKTLNVKGDPHATTGFLVRTVCAVNDDVTIDSVEIGTLGEPLRDS